MRQFIQAITKSSFAEETAVKNPERKDSKDSLNQTWIHGINVIEE